MRCENLRAFEQYLQKSAPQQLSPIYLILGKDAGECRKAAQLLLHHLLPTEEMRQFALTLYDGAQLDEKELANTLYSGSLFSSIRVVWIRDADKLKKGSQESLEKYFGKPAHSQYLLMSATGWQKNTLFYKAADKGGVILDLAELKPWEKEKQLIDWVNKEAMAGRKQMSYEACQFLVRRARLDEAFLKQELDKLICYCLDKNEITPRDIEAVCPAERVDTVWQWGEAIFRRNAAAALQIGKDQLLDGHPLLQLLRQLRSQFQTQYQISLLLAKGKQPQDIVQLFPYMKGQILERNIQQARHYGASSFKEGILAIDKAELRVKNSGIDEKILLELLMVQLTQNKQV